MSTGYYPETSLTESVLPHFPFYPRRLDHAPSTSSSDLSTTLSMDMCVLRPPNSRQFSDDVITSVVQRSRRIRNSLVAVANVLSPDAEYHPAQHSDAHTPDRNSYPTREMGVTPPERWRATSPQSNSTCMAFTDQKRKREDLQSSVSMSSPTAGGGVPEKTVLVKHEDQLAVMARLVLSEKQRVRELRRMRQIRYRKKKDNYALSLEEEARRLREEIEKLAQEQRAAYVAVSAVESVWSVAAEYFRIFQYGIRQHTSTLQADQGAQFSVYGRFLRSTVAPDVVFNSENGQEAMLTSWRSLSLWFKDVELELEGLEKAGLDSVVATTITSATITQQTLQCVFPHLRADTTGSSARSRLADKLLGQRIAMRGSMRFSWGRESRRVERVMGQSDMLTPMLRLLGNLEDVSVVFEGALVTLDFQWNP